MESARVHLVVASLYKRKVSVAFAFGFTWYADESFVFDLVGIHGPHRPPGARLCGPRYPESTGTGRVAVVQVSAIIEHLRNARECQPSRVAVTPAATVAPSRVGSGACPCNVVREKDVNIVKIHPEESQDEGDSHVRRRRRFHYTLFLNIRAYLLSFLRSFLGLANSVYIRRIFVHLGTEKGKCKILPTFGRIFPQIKKICIA